MASAAQGGGRQRPSTHESFLRHAGFRWLKIAVAAALIAILGYVFADVGPRPNGGTWMGYALGTIGLVLIVWLSLLGIRKRAMTSGRWSLKAWTSAHVYLGLALIVVATLHTGFQFGWNVHTLAYVLMMLVILSGVWGITAYATLPAALGQNRGEMTQGQMMEGVRALDRQLHDAAQPLAPGWAALVQTALEQDPFAFGPWTRLTNRYPRCATQAALDRFDRTPELERVESLLVKRRAQLGQMRRHLQIKALLEVWLYVHVPLTFALLAALTAHVVSVFYYW